MSAYRALIVDDEPLARRRIRAFLGEHSDVQIVGECGQGAEAIRVIQETQPDIVFLDVQMPKLNGFEVLERIEPHEMPIVVFVTAYQEHALRAFDVDALDYLLKPFDSKRFAEALQRARRQIELLRSGDGVLQQRLLKALRHLPSGTEYVTRLAVKNQGRVYFVNVDEIQWIEADGKYVHLHTMEATHLLRMSMQGLEEKLDPERFARIHRSTIVNLDAVSELQPMFHGDYAVMLRNGKELTLSRSYKPRLRKLLDSTG